MNSFFDYDKYWNQNLVSLNKFQRLIMFINDDTAIKTHITGFGLTLDMDKIISDYKADFTQTLYIFANQMVAFYCTLLDSIIEEFFFCIFAKYPEKLKIFVNEEESFRTMLGFSLNDFLKYESKEEYVYQLSKKASKICNNGNIKKVFKRIERLISLDYSEIKLDAINELYTTRNKIIHENIFYKLDIDDLNKFNDGVDSLLYELRDALKKLDIEVKDSYVRIFDDD
ncbi:hypothetical protein PPYC1_07965 [Paenibacillus polymyxa]|uniref:MAE_28990/MAE_18760 family HEPN-like nuclease n=1 Tax=Paenibacillus polymyxa TaxID=1406 RepID=UPI0008FC7FE5|nr:MAE_28990/MAE_18760 family HEPN-like nuclease [Paenibacillus polymyxa]APB70288.1 hypothetical protein PPYC1_07965 [Paenibacillus polymyxa]